MGVRASRLKLSRMKWIDRLRRAFRDDWQSIRKDEKEGMRELEDEMRGVDKLMLGWHDEQLQTLDRSLDEVTAALEQRHADNVASKERRLGVDERGFAELKAQIEEARRRRQAIAGSPPAGQKAAFDRYSVAVHELQEKWRRVS
jgi:hypothetical protein